MIKPYAFRSTVQKCFQKIEGMCRAKMDLESVRQVAHSYFGILAHANAFKEQGRLANFTVQARRSATFKTRRFPMNTPTLTTGTSVAKSSRQWAQEPISLTV